MKRPIVAFLILLSLYWQSVCAFDVNAIIRRMPESQNIKCGKAPEIGIWIIAKGVVFKDNTLSQNEMSEMGLAVAKKEMAAFIGTHISGRVEYERTHKTVDINGEEKSEFTEFLREANSIDINQFLRGVAVISQVDKGDVVWVYCFTSGSVINAASEMEAQKLQLPPNTVRAIGLSVLNSGNLETQRQAALASARRMAVEQVLGSNVAATTQVQDSAKIQSKIYANAAGFVEEYRILSEGDFPGGYRIEIVARVAKDKLLSDYSAVMKSMGDPGFAIRTNHQELYHSLNDFFTSLGIRVLTEPTDADYIIDAMGDFRAVRHPATGITGVQLSLWLRIFDARSGQELFAMKNDPKKAAVFHAKGERQVELSAEKAYQQLRRPLHEKLNAMLGKMATTGREIRVFIENYSSAFSPEVELIVKSLEMTPGCSNANMNVNSITAEAVIRVNYTATIEALSKFLVARIEKDIPYPARRPRVVSFTNAELRLSF